MNDYVTGITVTMVYKSVMVFLQCWVDYSVNVICYNYMLLFPKSNPLQLHITVKQM